MTRAPRFLSLGVAAAALLTALPLTALAQGRTTATCPAVKTHSLPKGAAGTTVVNFGIRGGSIRPWSVKIALGGAVTPSGTASTRQELNDPKNSLKAVLTLADAVGYFSMKKSVGCAASAGNPDVSSRFILIHTSTGAKGVEEFGSCAATSKYDQLFDILQASVATGS